MLVTVYGITHSSPSGAGEDYFCVMAKKRGESMLLGDTLGGASPCVMTLGAWWR